MMFNKRIRLIVTSLQCAEGSYGLGGCYFKKVELMSGSCVVCATLSKPRSIIVLTNIVTVLVTQL